MQAPIKSLKSQLLIWVLIPLFIVLAVSTIASYYRALHFANLAYDRSLFRATLALADQVVVSGDQILINLPQVAKDLLDYDKDDVISYRISAPNGQLIIGEKSLTIPKWLPKAGDHLYYDSQLNHQPVRVVAFSLPIENAPIQGNILVQVAETRTKREAMVTEIVEEMIVPQLLILVLAAALIFIGIKRGLLPLQRLQNAINQRSHLDLSPLSTHDTPIELHPLLNAMNNLMQRVREAVNLQQQFIADASHQLRTPIAGLQTQAELALREKNPALIHSTLTLILSSASRLSHLLNRLLSMASVDPASGRETQRAPINLISLVTEVTSQFVQSARNKHVDLGIDIQTPNASILGDEMMLREMLNNLIDNAICYTPNNGLITVCVAQSQQHIQLSIIDNGIGIPPAERSRVFERFHRVNDSDGDGCGLGLAIVNEIVLAHDATITIQDGLSHPHDDGFGTQFVISFKLHTSV